MGLSLGESGARFWKVPINFWARERDVYIKDSNFVGFKS